MPYVRKTHVTVEFGDPIDLKALPKEEQRRIGQRVQGIIGQMLERNYEG
jgi:1-acyl-sn-glycerol-3-phosphate acyltransferase